MPQNQDPLDKVENAGEEAAHKAAKAVIKKLEPTFQIYDYKIAEEMHGEKAALYGALFRANFFENPALALKSLGVAERDLFNRSVDNIKSGAQTIKDVAELVLGEEPTNDIRSHVANAGDVGLVEKVRNLMKSVGGHNALVGSVSRVGVAATDVVGKISGLDGKKQPNVAEVQGPPAPPKEELEKRKRPKTHRHGDGKHGAKHPESPPKTPSVKKAIKPSQSQER